MLGIVLEVGYSNLRKKIQLGRKVRKMLKKNLFIVWIKKVMIVQKEEKNVIISKVGEILWIFFSE